MVTNIAQRSPQADAQQADIADPQVSGFAQASGLADAGGLAQAGEHSDRTSAVASSARPRLRLAEQITRSILVAGGNPIERQAVLQALADQLPPGTRFEEAEATWQVLERAGSSRMVMLAGELDGCPPESVVQLLGSRHPELPVVSLATP